MFIDFRERGGAFVEEGRVRQRERHIYGREKTSNLGMQGSNLQPFGARDDVPTN